MKTWTLCSFANVHVSLCLENIQISPDFASGISLPPSIR